MPLQYGNNSINIKSRIFKFGSNAEWTMAICVASGGNGFFFLSSSVIICVFGISL